MAARLRARPCAAAPRCTALAAAASLALGAAQCPPGATVVDSFVFSGTGALPWLACEDLQVERGGLTLVPQAGAGSAAVHFPKTFEPFWQGSADDREFYLGLGKPAVLGAMYDMLGVDLLSCGGAPGPCEPTWARVKSAVPPIRYSGGDKTANWQCSVYAAGGGVRTFTGSRSASVDATFSDHANDCSDNGFPSPLTYVMNLTSIAAQEPPIADFNEYVNFTAMAEGLLGGYLPNLVFYFTLKPQNFSGFGGSRYWSMVASPVPDMQGGREQSVWFRFQQVRCAGAARAPPCELLGKPQYFDTYWFSSNPVTLRWIRPELMGNASGFYENLLWARTWWRDELATEGAMQLQLPDTPATNGTWLHLQAVHSIVRSMITRDDTWHPRYGVLPGYGVTLQDGFEDVFTATATAALEWGAMAYARGVIDNHLRFYVRNNGMVSYRAEELAQFGRMLTIFALYTSMSGDDALLLGHFGKARALAELLLYRYSQSLAYPPGDARFGIPGGGDEGDGFVAHIDLFGDDFEHKYSAAGNAIRGFSEIGAMWLRIGAATGRADVVAHGQALLAVVPAMRAQMQTSLGMTTKATGDPRCPRCVPTDANTVDAVAVGAEGGSDPPPQPACNMDTTFRSYREPQRARGVCALSGARAEPQRAN